MISRVVWKPKVHNSAPFVLILSYINPVHAPSYFLNTDFNIILPYTPRYSKRSLFLRLPHQNPVCTPLTIRATWPSEGSVHPNNSRWTVQPRKSPSCSLLLPPVTSSLSAPDIFLSTSFSNTLSLFSSVSVTNQAVRPFAATVTRCAHWRPENERHLHSCSVIIKLR